MKDHDASTESEIRRRVVDLGPGGKHRGVCPFCAAQHENSFEVRRGDDKPYIIFFRCYRGTCDAHGSIIDREGARLILSAPDDVQEPDAEWPTYKQIPREFLGILKEKYGDLPLEEQGAQYDEERKGLCMPWLDYTGMQKGWVEKRFDPAFGKSHHLLVHRSDKSRLAFPRLAHSYETVQARGIAVMVEDLLSAYRILDARSRGVLLWHIHPIALLGAQISTHDAALVGKLFDRALVLLDPDQFPKGTLRVMKAMRPFVNVRGTTLKADPKDTKTEELVEFLGTVEGMF